MAERRVPRIRFKGFEEDWEQRKLGEMAVISTGYPFNSNEFSPEGKYLVITNGNIQDSFTNVDESVGNRITLLDRKILDSYILDIGDILITMDGTVGRTAKVAGNGLILAQRVGRVKPIGNTEFMYQALSTGDFSKAMTELSHGGTIKHISLNEISLFEFKSPVREREQNTVGKLLYLFDTLLSLHQRKLEKLKILKKAMLEKMFPKNGEKVPEIRFSGFADDWEQRKFDDMFECCLANNTLSRAQLSYDEGMIFNIHYGDILTKYGAILDVQTATIPYIVEGKLEEFKDCLLQEGDIVIADTAEDETAGKTCEVSNLQGAAIVAGLHTVVGRPKIKMAIGYLGYYLNSGVYRNQLIAQMQGIKVLSLSRHSIRNTKVGFPITKEQACIAGFLFRLDSLLSLHQRKLEKLRQIKKSMLERMFV